LELFDRQKDWVGQGERTLLVYVELPGNRHIHNGLEEFIELANSSGLEIIQALKVNRNIATAQYFIGSGKVEEIAELAKENEIELVIFAPELSPSQERNLEKKLNCQVMDRTGLILDIFAFKSAII
jgi:GTP-binding protein HflX (EC 3.1.5.-)